VCVCVCVCVFVCVCVCVYLCVTWMSHQTRHTVRVKCVISGIISRLWTSNAMTYWDHMNIPTGEGSNRTNFVSLGCDTIMSHVPANRSSTNVCARATHCNTRKKQQCNMHATRAPQHTATLCNTLSHSVASQSAEPTTRCIHMHTHTHTDA